MAEAEWTPLVGVRNVSLRLLLRGVVTAIIWTPVIWFVTPGMNALPAHWAVWGVIGFILVVIGFAIGYGMCRDVSDSAGFSGMVLMAIAVSFIALTCYACVAVADLLRPVGEWQQFFLVAGPGMGASAYALKETLLE